MTRNELIFEIRKKQSFLCIGLDPDLKKIPNHLLKDPDPFFSFNKAIIKATHSFCVAYKPNLAFFEALGLRGMESLYRTVDYLREYYPNIFVIADGKRGDIGNTAAKYADAYFNELNADALTLSPYMGKDSIDPFLKQDGKWAVLLALTSNAGSADFQMLSLSNKGTEKEAKLFEEVIRVSSSWGNESNIMYVVGATQPEWIQKVRNLIPRHFLLVPGIGTQGGDLETVCRLGMNDEIGILVNVSRNIIYAGSSSDFAEKAAAEAEKLQLEMSHFL